ncbi:Coiled-coil domain-containing protein 33 [Branchiostoma belcheri]|nr:Coiled-coil domain-containing protein 33 [Branchiostoma belcheri]
MATDYYRPYTASPLKDGEWPGMDAVQDVLPEYISETTQPPPRRPPKDGLRQSYQPDDPYSHSLLEHQSKELDNYRAALKRMGADILKLREDIARLEAENSQLRRNLHMNRDAADALVGPAGLQALSRGDLVDKYALLQQKVSQQASSIKGQKERIQQLQNELIKKNDREAELLKQQKAQKPQQPVAPKVPENDGKKKKMEDTIKRQEEVIEKMEKLLNKQLEKGTLPADRSLEAHSALAAENARLRDELNRAKEPSQPHYPPGVKMDDEERLDLMAKLEKAEGRIISLENQLTENARMWGREKQELLIRMNERENGFARSSQMVLHDFPMSMALEAVSARVLARHRNKALVLRLPPGSTQASPSAPEPTCSQGNHTTAPLSSAYKVTSMVSRSIVDRGGTPILGAVKVFRRPASTRQPVDLNARRYSDPSTVLRPGYRKAGSTGHSVLVTQFGGHSVLESRVSMYLSNGFRTGLTSKK